MFKHNPVFIQEDESACCKFLALVKTQNRLAVSVIMDIF